MIGLLAWIGWGRGGGFQRDFGPPKSVIAKGGDDDDDFVDAEGDGGAGDGGAGKN